jgi:hypothetical protein
MMMQIVFRRSLLILLLSPLSGQATEQSLSLSSNDWKVQNASLLKAESLNCTYAVGIQHRLNAPFNAFGEQHEL